MRIDKFLWAVRIYKTRGLASKACKDNHIMILGQRVKPSRELKIGDEINVKKNPIWRKYKVKGFLKNRVGAKLVVDYINDITPDLEIEKLKMMKLTDIVDRRRILGRPTKKDRRSLNDLHKDLDY